MPAPQSAAVLEVIRASAKIGLLVGDDKELRDELHETQRSAARALNRALRALWQADGAVIDANGGRAPRPWPLPHIEGSGVDGKGRPRLAYAYPLIGRVAPELPAAMRSLLARRAREIWARDRFDALVRMTRRPPHMRDTVPIPLRAADTSVELVHGTYRLVFSLRAGRGNTRRCPLLVKDAHHRRILDSVIAGVWKMGDVAVLRDERNRWYVRVAYKRRVPVVQRTKAAAINRGIRWFLFAVTDEDETWRVPGEDIVQHLRAYRAMRWSYQRSAQAAARSGRGRKHILRPLERLSGKTERWRQTRCQTIARRFAGWCASKGVGVVYLEDLTGIRDEAKDRLGERVGQQIHEWPYYQLGMRIRACLEEAGIRVEGGIDAHNISQTCPACGHVDPESRDFRHWKLICAACGGSWHLDEAAARNVLARGRERSAGDDAAGAKSQEEAERGGGQAKTARKPGGNGARSRRSGRRRGKT